MAIQSSQNKTASFLDQGWGVRFVAPLLAVSFGLLLYVLVAMQRPQPFTTSVDGIGYFLPLVSAVWNHWLDGVPLRVLWDLGQGWVPWESGQVGYLYPGYIFPALFSRLFGQPLLLLEYSAALHLGILGLMAWMFPPRTTTPIQRLLIALAVTASSGSFLIGMNWHNYLTPAPWFAGLLGLVFRPLLDRGQWEMKHRIGVLLFSSLFYASGHPQMYVLAFVLISIAVVGIEPSRKGLAHLLDLAVLQVPFVAPLAFLYLLAQDASPIWISIRDEASMLRSSVPAGVGVTSILLGQGHPALFHPLAMVVAGVALINRRWPVLVSQLLLLALVVPSFFPELVGVALAELLHGFRWPDKLAVYVLPLSVVLLMSLRLTRPIWWCVGASILASVLNVALRQDEVTSLRSVHSVGVAGVIQSTQRCLSSLGVETGSRVAFVGRYRYNKESNGISTEMQGVANNAPLLVGLESQHLYEPLEPAEVAEAHEFLTLFWRQSLDSDALSERRLGELRREGVDYLLAANPDQMSSLGLSANCDKSMYALKIGDGTPFPDAWRGKERVLLNLLPNGGIETTVSIADPPSTNSVRINTTPERWVRLSDGRWRWEPPWPESRWIWATLGAWVFALTWCCRFRKRG